MGPITPKELHFVISISLISILSKEVNVRKHFCSFASVLALVTLPLIVTALAFFKLSCPHLVDGLALS